MFVNPRFDFPPGVNFEPWFVHHRAFAEESGRLSAFLDAARPECEVAVLYPLRTGWACGPGHHFGAHTAVWTEYLARAGIGFHLVDERDLRAATVASGKIFFSDRGYSTVVLPGVEVVKDIATVEVLQRMRAAGGTVLASGELPAASQQRGSDPALTAMASAACTKHWPDTPTIAELDMTLRGGRVRTADPNVTVWTSSGRDDHGTRVAFFVDSPHRQTVTVIPPSVPASVRRFDATTGEILDLGTTSGALRLECHAEQLVCLLFTDGPTSVPADIVLSTGWSIDIGEGPRPVRTDIGWERQGMAEYSGIAEYRLRFDMPDPEWPEWELVLPAVHTAAEVTLNGTEIANLAWPPYSCPIPRGLLKPTGNVLKLFVASTAANAYYAKSGQRTELAPSGLAAFPCSEATSVDRLGPVVGDLPSGSTPMPLRACLMWLIMICRDHSCVG
ncbi:hypothetical protein LWC34_12370 [Kibdelosporangium philippinense]|uniref:Glycosyl hydrolases family 2 sugar binding domain-containing protein n=1 Tax=Kibdelosporangium philippinense TaxID=211113 RepID=A0ABS8Z6W0_9PSEU|nr:hypothetical protein [Kibdelosporangium philippinense]MCE7003615.1 hypothetical protein [Kibdelosporangium philippinense]